MIPLHDLNILCKDYYDHKEDKKKRLVDFSIGNSFYYQSHLYQPFVIEDNQITGIQFNNSLQIVTVNIEFNFDISLEDCYVIGTVLTNSFTIHRQIYPKSIYTLDTLPLTTDGLYKIVYDIDSYDTTNLRAKRYIYEHIEYSGYIGYTETELKHRLTPKVLSISKNDAKLSYLKYLKEYMSSMKSVMGNVDSYTFLDTFLEQENVQ